jgi:membrane protein involved in colicin uptake
MQQYLLKRGPLHHNGNAYAENDPIALTDAEAAPLLRLGIIEPDAEAQAAADAKAAEEAAKAEAEAKAAADAKAAEEAAKAEAEAKAAADAKAAETTKAPTAKAKK